MTVAPEPGRSSGWPQLAAAALAVLAFVLTVVGIRVQDVPPDWPDTVYRSLQLFTLEGDALAGLVLNPWLQVARFLAPAATLLVVILTVRTLLGDQWRRRRIATTRDHVIVCGESASALALARNLRESGSAVVLVAAADAEAPSGGAIPAVPGDPREPATLRAAGIVGARSLYACAEHSAVNAAVALAAGRLRSAPGPRLSTFAQVRSDDLVDALRVRRLRAPQPNTVTMDFFALDDIAARLLVARHPVGDAVPVVVGFGPLGQAVLRAIVRGSGTAPPPRPIIVVTAAGEHVVEAEAARLDAGSRGWSVRLGQENDGEGPVYICLADEDEAISTGLRLGRRDDRDVVVCLQRESPFSEALDATARVKIFGLLDETCREAAITEDSIIGRIARAVHERYCSQARARGDRLATNPSTAPWVDLPVSLQESNFAQAEGIGEKLLTIRASLTTQAPATPFSYREGEVDTLARLEHARWVRERRAAGFRYGPSRQGREHPDLVDWSNLSTESQQKDRDTVRALPDLLATEGLYIVRDATS